MSFASPLVGTFVFEGIISSASMNIINLAIPKALDKTGDSTLSTPSGGISGLIEVLPTGSMNFDTGSTLTLNGVVNLNSSLNVSGTTGSVNFANNSNLIIGNNCSETISAGASLIFNPGMVGAATPGLLKLASGSVATEISFQNGSGIATITQANQNSSTSSGNNLSIIAQSGGSGTSTNGGAVVLQGGVGGPSSTRPVTGGSITIGGGSGLLNTTGSVSLNSGTGTGFPGTVDLQTNYQYLPPYGSQSSQAGQILKQVFYCNTSGTATQSFTPYIFTLIGSSTFVAEITYTCHNVPIGGKYYLVGVVGSTPISGASYGTAATITNVGSNLSINITPPAGGDSTWQVDCYLQLN